MADISSLNLADVKRELIETNRECSLRGLLHGAKWAAEMSFSLEADGKPEVRSSSWNSEAFLIEYDNYALAKCYFDLKEYSRTAYFLEQLQCKSNVTYFLYMYSRYLAEEKRKVYNMSDSLSNLDFKMGEEEDRHKLKTLQIELGAKHKEKQLDAYCLYLYGIVLKKLDLVKNAFDVLVEAVNEGPLHWWAWQELALLITDKDTLMSLSLPNHWMKELFLAYMYSELQQIDEALKIYQAFVDHGFSKSSYIQTQIAIAYDNIRNFDQAVDSFMKLREMDPYRLDNMDTFSNLLFVKEMRMELAALAHKCCEIDKYRVETCCVIANYYSLRSQHEQSLLYFQRALKLNPHYLSAWTLIGHEYMEMKNTSAAIEAYRQAIEVNRRDYRAWYGLGQTYEIIKMPFYSLYYYWKAQQLRPNDSRMLVALGDAYEKLDRLQEAKKCFWKAHSVGDVEGTALIKLARLYERLNEEEKAAAAYSQYINQANTHSNMADQGNYYTTEEMSQAYRYLANYNLRLCRLDDAYFAAQQCTEYNETKEEAKALLRQIAHMRAGEGAVQMESSTDSLAVEQYQQGTDNSPIVRMGNARLRFTPP